MRNRWLFLGVIVLSTALVVLCRLTFLSDNATLPTGQQVTQSAMSHSAVLIQQEIESKDSVPKQKVVERVNQTMSEHFALVAAAYADEIKFPSYSLPLTSNDRQLLQPNTYQPQAIPLEQNGSASILLDKYRFIYPEPVTVRLQVKNIQVYGVSLSLFDEATNKLLTTSKLQTDADGFGATLSADHSWDGPLRIEVEFKHGSQSQIVQTGFEYNQPVAKITDLGGTYVEGSDLVIPVHIKVTFAGFYRLRANLFTADYQPLAVLTANGKLAEGEDQLKLRVYKSILKNNPKSLWLSTFQLEKRSAAPGDPTRYGDSEKPGFFIEYSIENTFSDEEYQPSEEEQQRLTFLKQMAEQR